MPFKEIASEAVRRKECGLIMGGRASNGGAPREPREGKTVPQPHARAPRWAATGGSEGHLGARIYKAE